MIAFPRHLALGLGLLVALAAPALAGNYLGGGNFVAKDATLGTLVDNGGVVCRGMDGSGVGGGCLPFPAGGRRGGFVKVQDEQAGLRVAFQVCIDNNGDGICGGPQTNPICQDQAFFSHADGGRFFNPLGPLPTASLRECPNAFQGYVVFLCQGTHNDAGAGPHQHLATTGTITPAQDGFGYGDFCGGGGGSVGAPATVPTVAKAYTVI